jgi:hypothetical protein
MTRYESIKLVVRISNLIILQDYFH